MRVITILLLAASVGVVGLLAPRWLAAASLNAGNLSVVRSVLMSPAAPVVLTAEAAAYYGRAAELDERNPRVYAAIGLLQWTIGNHHASIEAFRRATDLAPQDSVSWLRLGNAYRAEDDIGAARQAWEQSGFTRLLVSQEMNVGFEKAEELDWAGTEAAFKRALEIDPSYPQGYYNLAGLYWGQGRWAEVEWAIRKQLELDHSESFEVYFSAGRLSFLKKDWRAAATAFEKAVQFKPNDGWSFNFLGLSQYQLREYDPALTNLQNAAKLLPGDFRSRALLSRLYSQRNDPVRAQVYLNQALVLTHDLSIVESFLKQFE